MPYSATIYNLILPILAFEVALSLPTYRRRRHKRRTPNAITPITLNAVISKSDELVSRIKRPIIKEENIERRSIAISANKSIQSIFSIPTPTVYFTTEKIERTRRGIMIALNNTIAPDDGACAASPAIVIVLAALSAATCNIIIIR